MSGSEPDSQETPGRGSLVVRVHTGSVPVLAKPDTDAAHNTIWNILSAAASTSDVDTGSDEFVHAYRVVEAEYSHLWEMRRLIASCSGEGVRTLMESNILELTAPDRSKSSLEAVGSQIIGMTQVIADVCILTLLTLAALDGLGEESPGAGSRLIEFHVPLDEQ